jgi:sodium/hydrogen exchanger-like protein 6/7
MFETARQFHGPQEATIYSLFKGIGVFFVVFTVSLIIGVSVGIGTALLLKHTYIRRFPGIESCFILLVSYASYLFSNGCHMSGNTLKKPQKLPAPLPPLINAVS